LVDSREAVKAIHAIAAIDFTPIVAAQIAGVLAERIGACSWSHFLEALSAKEKLEEAHHFLTEGEA
jgi:hypothetical protein